ncbi:MAG: bifunctional oligoribonuclease/PAP phosphatase NrnA [Cyanobacteria bacterium P01_H01_bin.74]
MKTCKTVFITAHVGPDGDTLGSMLALKLALGEHVKHLDRIDCVISGKMPDVFSFLPGIGWVMHMEDDANKLCTEYDMAISVDCGSPDRLGLAQPVFNAAKLSVNIDHHISNVGFATLNLIDTSAAASTEVIYDLLMAMNIPVDENVATCLYVGIITDTGCFRYSNTTGKVLQIASQLVSAGARPEFIYRQMFEEQPLEKLQLHAKAFLNASFNTDKTVAWTVVTQSLLAEMHSPEEYVEGIVELLRRIDTVVVAFVIRETPAGTTKVSIRSDRETIDVSEIMAQFNGGGHRLAAGCSINATLDSALDQLLPLIAKAVDAYQLTPHALS